ncbi:MAG: DeoR/GlpR transcriptional regulator [Clostridiales bacterium]|nr:DeoR/GlpR transcriptional regulator [Clostridiales bacterium]
MNTNAQKRAKNSYFSQKKCDLESFMALTERQNEILRRLKEDKKAVVTVLAKELYVSEATIRRDLAEMHSMGLIERSHGGALLPENAEEISIFFRMEKNASEKERVATKALPYIPSFKSVFIDSSSTALALAERIDLNYKTVVTNNLQTAIQLSKKPNINLILLGGNVHFNTNSATGSWTARQLNDFSFDLMISSCAAIIGSESFERSLEQKEIKRVAFEHCKKRVILIDHTKFEAHGTYRLAALSEYDLVVTDVAPPETLDVGNAKLVY